VGISSLDIDGGPGVETEVGRRAAERTDAVGAALHIGHESSRNRVFRSGWQTRVVSSLGDPVLISFGFHINRLPERNHGRIQAASAIVGGAMKMSFDSSRRCAVA